MPKYGNRKTVVDGITFDSLREAARWGELRMLERAGHISQLKRQVIYELAPSVKFSGTRRAKPALRYIVDFTYREGDALIAEDVKGMQTKEFQIKRHLMLALLGVDVRVTK